MTVKWSECKTCGHVGCDGTECIDARFVRTNHFTGKLEPECAICCREILRGEPEHADTLRQIADGFRVLMGVQ